MMAKRVIALVLASPFVVASVGRAAPPPAPAATKFQTTLTNNTDPTNTSTVHISKASKMQIKVSAGNVCFNLKLKGVVDNATGDPVNLSGPGNSSWQVDFNVGGGNRSIMRNFDLVNGNITSSTAKPCIATSDTAAWGSALSPGTPIEIKRVRLTYDGDGDPFAVAGLTTK